MPDAEYLLVGVPEAEYQSHRAVSNLIFKQKHTFLMSQSPQSPHAPETHMVNDELKSVILELPETQERAYGRRPAPYVRITPTRITVRSDTYSLEEVREVRLERVHIRSDLDFLKFGCVLIVIGSALFYWKFWIPIGLLAWLIGLKFLWDGLKKEEEETGRIYLIRPRGKQLCYQEELGVWDQDYLRKCGYDPHSEKADAVVRQYHINSERAENVARAIGKAIGLTSHGKAR